MPGHEFVIRIKKLWEIDSLTVDFSSKPKAFELLRRYRAPSSMEFRPPLYLDELFLKHGGQEL